jgi:hypothetical protein
LSGESALSIERFFTSAFGVISPMMRVPAPTARRARHAGDSNEHADACSRRRPYE